MKSPRPLVVVFLAIVACVRFVSFPAAALAAPDLPASLSDEEFWRMINEFSEPSGYFHSENFNSNELAFQYVIPEIKRRVPANGVYIGVGPEQNFTYIVAMNARLSFVLDIRRQNMLEHLLYKALMELSPDRAEFLSRLFCRKLPADLGPTSSVGALFGGFKGLRATREAFQQNMEAVRQQLVTKHRFALTADDIEQIQHVYTQFYEYGPTLSYSFPGAGPGVLELFPAYSDLMTATDATNTQRSYLVSEESYRAIRDAEVKNLVVPIVGDFAGPKAVRAMGDYVKAHGATVSIFYTSNVEQYLFQQDDAWKRFYANVAALPLDEQSVFIRSVASNGVQGPGPLRLSMPGLNSITDFLSALGAGRVQTYSDVLSMSR
jgi:hypothetical protein